MKEILLVVFSYLCGSIPTSIIIGKTFRKIDIREHGSKNPGATNAYRVLGKKLGIIVLIIDVLKGIFPVFISNQLGVSGNMLMLIGVSAILGHTFSLFLNFKGGKGVATSLGVFSYFAPLPILVLVIIFILVAYFSKFISLGSIVSAALLPVLILIFPISCSVSKKTLFLVSLFIGIFVIYKHKSNIKRLMKHSEKKFKL